MTALPIDLRPRLARLIPLLGSPVEGEVAAAARAIGRLLGSAGRDLHDLAAELSAADEVAARHPQPVDFVRILDECLAAEARLSDRDRRFVESLADQVARRRQPSDRQMSWLLDIHRRIRRAA